MTFINNKRSTKNFFESKLKCDEMDNLQFLLVAKQFEDKDINYLSSHKGAKQIPNEISDIFSGSSSNPTTNSEFRFYLF